MSAYFSLIPPSLFAQQQSDLDPAFRQALKQSIAQASSFEDRFDAAVWLLDMSTRIAPFLDDKLERVRILKAVHAQSAIHDIPTDVILSVIETESHYKAYALSPVGAQGLMQIMPFWKDEIGRPEDNLMNIETNVRYGCAILKHYLKREKGNLQKALARYNGSYGKTRYSDKVLKRRQRYFWSKSTMSNLLAAIDFKIDKARLFRYGSAAFPSPHSGSALWQTA